MVGLIRGIYDNQKINSKHRDHQPPEYTLDELTKYCLNSTVFVWLYDKWVASGFDSELTPSFDRDDDNKGYSFDNLRCFCAWSENRDRSYIDKITGINNKNNTAVIQMRMDGTFVTEHHSMADASRKTKATQPNIHRACNNKTRTAGGFRWMYSIGECHGATN